MSNFFKNDLITISAHYYTLITSNSYIYIYMYVCMYVCMYVMKKLYRNWLYLQVPVKQLLINHFRTVRTQRTALAHLE